MLVCCQVDPFLIYFNLFLQERSGNNSFTHDALTLKYKLDNEFELLFVVSIFIFEDTYTCHMVLQCIQRYAIKY